MPNTQKNDFDQLTVCKAPVLFTDQNTQCLVLKLVRITLNLKCLLLDGLKMSKESVSIYYFSTNI